MFKIGCHLSISKGFTAMGNDAIKIGANTFQFFTRNPRGTKAKDVDLEDINGILEIIKKYKFSNILAHAPYTLNPCSSNEKTRELALELISDDLNRMELLPNNLYNLHPGSHVGQGVEIGINQIVFMLNSVLKVEQKTIVLLETMAGKGTEIGKSFEEIAEIIKKVDLNEKLGVCLDTCHVNDAGYDIGNKLDEVLEHFDKVIGFDRLYAIHLNDSMNSIGSHKDRHAKIGEGTIGIEAISNIINHPKLRNLPFYLETPNDLEGYGNEIKILKNLYKC